MHAHFARVLPNIEVRRADRGRWLSVQQRAWPAADLEDLEGPLVDGKIGRHCVPDLNAQQADDHIWLRIEVVSRLSGRLCVIEYQSVAFNSQGARHFEVLSRPLR